MSLQEQIIAADERAKIERKITALERQMFDTKLLQSMKSVAAFAECRRILVVDLLIAVTEHSKTRYYKLFNTFVLKLTAIQL